VVEKVATTDDVSPSVLEQNLLDTTLKPNIQLVLYRQETSQPTTDTARWLDNRDVALHHHIALDSEADFARLGRFVRGEAIGLVLCGGGSFGTAHLGVIQALHERGYTFDFYGGTSIGAAMGGSLAIGLSTGRIMDLCEDLFIKSKAMSRFTVPKHSVFDHHRLDTALMKHFGRHNIEDMPINFFAVATSLTDNDVAVMRRGPLWQALRASASLPGVFPPFIKEDGEVLIDGGLIDNDQSQIRRSANARSSDCIARDPCEKGSSESPVGHECSKPRDGCRRQKTTEANRHRDRRSIEYLAAARDELYGLDPRAGAFQDIICANVQSDGSGQRH